MDEQATMRMQYIVNAQMTLFQFQAELEGMKIENSRAMMNGEAVTYREGDFISLKQRMIEVQQKCFY